MEKKLVKKKSKKEFSKVDVSFKRNDDSQPYYDNLRFSKKLSSNHIVSECNLDGKEWNTETLFFIMSDSLKMLINAQTLNSKLTLPILKSLIDMVKKKWDSVSNKMPNQGLSDTLWNAFYASHICLIGDALYPGSFTKRPKIIPFRLIPDFVEYPMIAYKANGEQVGILTYGKGFSDLESFRSNLYFEDQDDLASVLTPPHWMEDNSEFLLDFGGNIYKYGLDGAFFKY